MLIDLDDGIVDIRGPKEPQYTLISITNRRQEDLDSGLYFVKTNEKYITASGLLEDFVT